MRLQASSYGTTRITSISDHHVDHELEFVKFVFAAFEFETAGFI
jgi:hypothetical protein